MRIAPQLRTKSLFPHAAANSNTSAGLVRCWLRIERNFSKFGSMPIEHTHSFGRLIIKEAFTAMKKLHYQAIAITCCSLCLRCCLRHVFSASAAIPAATRSKHPHPHRQHPPRQRSRRQHPYPNLCANSQALIHPCFPCCIRSDKAAHLPAKVITKAKNNVHNRRYCFGQCHKVRND